MGVAADGGKELGAVDMDIGEQGGVGHPVDDGAAAVIHHQLVRHAPDGVDDLGALAAGVGDEHQMGDLLHDPAVDLLNARLAVDDHIVEVARQQVNDLLQIGVDLAVAARRLRTPDGKEGEVLMLHHGVENAVACLAQQLDGLPGRAVLHGGDDALADVVQRLPHLHAQRGGQPHGGVGVDGEDALVGIRLRQQPHKGGGKGGLAHAALTGDGDDLGGMWQRFSRPFAGREESPRRQVIGRQARQSRREGGGLRGDKVAIIPRIASRLPDFVKILTL